MLLYIPSTTGCDGSDFFMPWLWWMLGAFILGAILGWILKQLFGGSGDGDSIDYSGKIKGLEADLAACRKERASLASAATAATAIAVTPKGTTPKGTTPKIDDSIKDDYTKVEGIGPKIKELLNADGLWSFKQLSEASIDRLQKILDAAGPRYRVHNPKTWAKQALMAHEGKWDELKKWQDELDGGL